MCGTDTSQHTSVARPPARSGHCSNSDQLRPDEVRRIRGGVGSHRIREVDRAEILRLVHEQAGRLVDGDQPVVPVEHGERGAGRGGGGHWPSAVSQETASARYLSTVQKRRV